MSRAATPAAPTTTRSALLYDRIRADILAGKINPGARLPFAELVSRYNCSIGSLREVLQRLSELGLVESVAQQGFRVVSVSAEDLQDLIEARLEIEVAALIHAIRDGDLAWEAAAVAALHVLEGTPALRSDDPDQFSDAWAVAHTQFHQALLSGCGNRRLLSAAADLRDAAELYRRWSIPFGTDRHRDSAAEHRALLDASVRRDADLAAELLRQHITKTAYTLKPRVEEVSEPVS